MKQVSLEMENSKLKVLIVDDEKDSRDILRLYLSDNPEIGEILESQNAEDALFQFFSELPDIIFLDIFMPGRKGTELIELAQKRKIAANIVIVSSHMDYAITAIKNNIYDFLLKPIDPVQLNTIINKTRTKRTVSINTKVDQLLENYDDGKKIKLSSASNHILIDPEDIIYCRALGSYTEIVLKDGKKELANNNIGRVEISLEHYHFFRLQRSILVNMEQIINVDKTTNTCVVATTNNEKIELTGSKKQIRLLCEIDFEY